MFQIFKISKDSFKVQKKSSRVVGIRRKLLKPGLDNGGAGDRLWSNDTCISCINTKPTRKKKHNISYSLGLRKDEIYIRFLCVFSTRFC
jgi:hypothetical protein